MLWRMKTATSLPDHVLKEIDLFARRLRRSRSTLYAEAAAQVLRRARQAIADALDGVARGSVMLPPP
jgi:metal-responsive CopG/Arc/MetJ family transcriptional regulator